MEEKKKIKNNENKEKEKNRGIFHSIGDALKGVFANADKKDSNEERRKIEMQVDQIIKQQDNDYLSELKESLKPSFEQNENLDKKRKGKKGTRREIYEQVEEAQRKHEENNGKEIGDD